MSMFETFPLKCLAVIIDVAGHTPSGSGNSLECVKSALVDGLSTLESDDLVYVYRQEGDLAMGQTLAESIGVISDWQHEKLSVVTAFEESLVLASQYDGTDRGIFYVTDNYKAKCDGSLREVLNIDSDKRYGCSFFAYGIGRAYSKTLADIGRGHPAKYKFRHLDDPAGLAPLFAEDLKTL